MPHALAAWGPKDDFFNVKCCRPLFKKVVPTAAGSTFLQKAIEKSRKT